MHELSYSAQYLHEVHWSCSWVGLLIPNVRWHQLTFSKKNYEFLRNHSICRTFISTKVKNQSKDFLLLYFTYNCFWHVFLPTISRFYFFFNIKKKIPVQLHNSIIKKGHLKAFMYCFSQINVRLHLLTGIGFQHSLDYIL